LVIDPLLISTIGAVIAIVFGFLWARDATRELRGEAVEVEPERREAPADPHDVSIVEVPDNRVTRSVFLEGTTLGLGAAIGGLITLPVAGFAVLPSFLGQTEHKVDMGPITTFVLNRWYIATFILDPAEGEVSRRTAFIRNNGAVANPQKPSEQVPSFTIISNHCVHLGCPVQANGPSGQILGLPTLKERTANGPLTLAPVVPAGYGCPCHGGQYDPEGNRIAGPPVRALDRYGFEVNHGRLVLLSTYSVSHVVGTGAQAKIYKYKQYGPGQHVDGPEAWFYPLSPPQH
jgi:Rieske Fe-S protein